LIGFVGHIYENRSDAKANRERKMKRNAIPPNGFWGEPTDSDAYKEFDATELYCPNCKQSAPVRKRLLLVLPEGDKYEYLCAYCSETVGTKIDKQEKPLTLLP
jgi:hypothetical protein